MPQKLEKHPGEQRPKPKAIPLTDDEFCKLEDVIWAERDPLVVQKYKGEFVVPYQRQIVAHGEDIEAVLTEAAAKTGRRVAELLAVGIIGASLQDVPH